MEIFMNTSLPRAGSTLLQNIFAQNKDFYCTPTSGILDLLLQSRNNFTYNTTIAAQDESQMKEAFRLYCNRGIKGYFESLTDRKYVIDKNRGWGINYNFAEYIFDKKPKMIAMVRDLPQIVASLELKYRNSPHKDPGIVNHEEFINTTTLKRVSQFYTKMSPLATPLENLLDVIQQGISDKMLFIRYEDLCSDPHVVMDKVYDFLEVPRYKHDFEHIKQSTKENDTIHGIFGDHTIRHTLSYKDNNPLEVLGQESLDYLREQYAWYYKAVGY